MAIWSGKLRSARSSVSVAIANQPKPFEKRCRGMKCFLLYKKHPSPPWPIYGPGCIFTPSRNNEPTLIPHPYIPPHNPNPPKA